MLIRIHNIQNTEQGNNTNRIIWVNNQSIFGEMN